MAHRRLREPVGTYHGAYDPHHDWDELARTSRDGVRQDGAEWESLRNEIVALLDHVEDQVAGVRRPAGAAASTATRRKPCGYRPPP